MKPPQKFMGNIMVGQWEFEGRPLMYPTQLNELDKKGEVGWSVSDKYPHLLWPSINGVVGVYDEAE